MNGSLNLPRALSIARKEVRHILRDPFTLGLALGLPMILVLFFGFAMDFDVRNIRTVSYDSDNTQESRKLVEVFTSSQFFKVDRKLRPSTPLKDLDSERASVVIIVEPGFGKDLGAKKPVKAQVVIDGADNSTAGVVLGYLSGIQRAALKKLLGNSAPQSVIDLKTRFLFNPELNSRWFVVPGLIVVVLSILSVLLTALTVAREWETGSMELLLSTPVKPIEIILGKLAPYIVMGLSSVAFVYVMARAIFGVPFEGNYLFFAVVCLIFLGTTLAQGLLISVITRQQQLAMQLGIISGLLPSFLLSGFVFPIENMPVFFQYFTSVLPAKWFMMAVRGIFLKGAGIWDLAKPLLGLLTIHFVLIILTVKKFKKDLEP